MRALSATGMGLALVGPGLLLVAAARSGIVPGRGLLLGLAAALFLLTLAGTSTANRSDRVALGWTLPGLAAVVSVGLGWCYLALAPLHWWLP